MHSRPPSVTVVPPSPMAGSHSSMFSTTSSSSNGSLRSLMGVDYNGYSNSAGRNGDRDSNGVPAGPDAYTQNVTITPHQHLPPTQSGVPRTRSISTSSLISPSNNIIDEEDELQVEESTATTSSAATTSLAQAHALEEQAGAA